MKKFIVLAFLLATAVAMLPGGSSTPVQAQDGLEIIFVTHDLGAGVFAPVRKGMEDACDQIGASCEFLGPQTYDPAEHVALLEAAIAREQ